MSLDDDAERAEQIFRDAALVERARNAERNTLKPYGACYFCGESLRLGLLFCNTDCRDDWQREHDAHVRNGASSC